MLSDELDRARLENEIIELRRNNLVLQGKLVKAKAKVDALVAATIESARGAVIDLGGIGKVTPPARDKRKRREAVALWHLTDWQGGKKTPSYDSQVMIRRVNEFVSKAAKLTEDYRQARPVKHCVILIGGDQVEGLWNFPTQPYEIDATIFTQYVTVSKLLVETVQQALGIYETVEVIAEWGNHGRLGNRDKPKPDNLDRMCYELARQLLADEKRLTWHDCPDDWQKIEIGQYKAILIHGDEVGRNGYASASTLIAHVSRWASGAIDWTFRDCYSGHYHCHASYPLPNGGQIYQTGSTESENRYASVQLAATSTPSQRFNLIDPDRGLVIAEHKIWLEL